MDTLVININKVMILIDKHQMMMTVTITNKYCISMQYVLQPMICVLFVIALIYYFYDVQQMVLGFLHGDAGALQLHDTTLCVRPCCCCPCA